MRRRQKIYNFFLPHETNNYRAHALKHNALFSYVAIFLGLQIVLNLFFSSKIQVLGFSTSIYKNELIDLTNQQRAKEGLGKLTENEKLDEAAKLKAQNMFVEDYWAHISPTGISPWHWFDESGYQYYMAGENLARDFNTSAGVVSAWMDSTSHKENLLNSQFTEIGMAVVNGRLKGEDTTLVVQLFGRPEGLVAASNSEITGATSTVPLTTNNEALVSSSKEPVSLSLSSSLSDNWLALRSAVAGMFNMTNWGWGQRVAILMLFALLILFGLDSFVLYRERLLHLRKNSHSFLHAMIIVALLLGTMASGVGLLA